MTYEFKSVEHVFCIKVLEKTEDNTKATVVLFVPQKRSILTTLLYYQYGKNEAMKAVIFRNPSRNEIE